MADELNFSSPEELKDWLKKQPVVWSRVIAARSALRILPIAGSFLGKANVTGKRKNKLITSALRAIFISWAASRYPAHDMKMAAYASANDSASKAATSKAATSADVLISAYAVASVASASAYASAYASASAAVSASDAASDSAAAFAAISASSASTASADTIDFFDEINWDTGWLAARRPDVEIDSAAELAREPLWPFGESEWVAEQRKSFFSLPIEDLDIWQTWYERVAAGRPSFGLMAKGDEELAVKIALQEDDFWDRDFREINGEIKQWLDEARGENVPAEPETGPGPQYTLIGGRLAETSSAPLGSEAQSQHALHMRLKSAADELASASQKIDNSHSRLAGAIREFADILDCETEEIDVTGLWAVGGALTGFAQALREQNVNRTLAEPLEPELDAQLQNVVRQHGALIMGFEEGRDLVSRADEFNLDQDRLREIEKPGNQILGCLSEDKSLVDENTRNLHSPVRDYVGEFGWTTSRGGYTAYLIVRNAVRAIIRISVGDNPNIGAVLGLLAGTSVLAGDPNMEFIKAAIPFLQHNGAQMLAFFKHSPEMYSYVEWMLSILEKDKK